MFIRHNLSRETLVQRVKDIANQPHPMSLEIQGEAVLLEGQLDRFRGSTVADIRQDALALGLREASTSELHRNSSRAYGAASLLCAVTGMAGLYTGNAALSIAGLAGFVGAAAGAVVYDHTSSLYREGAQHTEATVARLDRWAAFIAEQK